MSAKRAINLARVSTPKQAELYSLDYQLEQMREYDKDIGLTIVAEFKDDVSGRKLARDGLEEACLMLERDEADVLVTWKFDRLHRNYVNSVVLRERIRKAGKEIHYAQSRTISGKTARQRLPEDLQYLMAEIDADDINERTSLGRVNKAKAGKWVGQYRPPYGYQTTTKGRQSAMELNPDTAPVVRSIFEWYVYGDKDGKPLTVTEIVDKLTALGIPSPLDHIQSHAHLKQRGYGQWSREGVYRILHDDAYRGVFYHNQHKAVGGKVGPNHSPELWIPIEIPPIVDDALFEAAKAKLVEGRKASPRGAVYEYLVGRRIKCECGYSMYAQSTGTIYERDDGTGREYQYHRYRCAGRSSRKMMLRSCDMPAIDVSRVDQIVWAWVKDEIANPVILERKLREIQSGHKEDQVGKQVILDTLYAHKAEIEDELLRLGKLYGTDMPRRLADQLISEENHKLVLTETEITKLERDMETPLTNDGIVELVEFSKKFAKHLKVVESSFDGRRTVIDGLNVRVVVLRKNGGLVLNLTSILSPEGVLRPLFSARWNSKQSLHITLTHEIPLRDAKCHNGINGNGEIRI